MLLSSEAEYMVLTEAVREDLFLRQLLSDLGLFLHLRLSLMRTTPGPLHSQRSTMIVATASTL
eukprot:scaffold534426_cov27-Prasinocladus_malaysianus.AAC.1